MFRLRSFSAWVLPSLLLILPVVSLAADAPSELPARTYLHKDWQIQSSCEVKAAGLEIATAGFDAAAWHHTDIPVTVVGALVGDKTYPDPDYAANLQKFPGQHNDRQTFFSNVDMPKDSPFRCSWWYRTEFTLPAGYEGKTNWLHLLGINYRANIWINGKQVASAADVAGTYASFEFNVGKYLRANQANALAMEIFAPGKDDLGMTWVDWNPTPPDKNMGIWKEVFLTSSGDVSVRNPFVSSKLDGEYKAAALAISGDLQNVTDHEVKGVLRAEFDGKQISQPVTLLAGQTKTLTFSADKFPELQLANPKLWWPYQMGEPYLYRAKLSFEIGSDVSDSASVSFGIREVTSELTEQGHRLFKVNGRKVLIRGAAWAPDLLLRWSSERVDADLGYVRDMGLNAIRLEGRLDREEFYEKTDRLGLLVMPGWTCCDAWQFGKKWGPEQFRVAGDSLRSQIRMLRNHPSLFVWLYGSDEPPPAPVEKLYLTILKELQWPNPLLSSASQFTAPVTGKSGVKMTGPYEFVPPVYWLADKEAGGAHGYNTETSPGPAIPPRESLEKFIPKDHLWPIDEVWNYHAGGERFTTINVFTDGLNKRYGTATSLDDYLRKSQAITYDGERAMFEAYGRNKYTATGVIQWMLNNAWPSLIWHLYDYYLVPAGGYFGTKKAMEPVHVQYSYDDNSVAVVNSTYQEVTNAKVTGKLYDIDAKEKGSRDATVNVGADASIKAFDLPKVENLSKTYFLSLQLHDAGGKLLSHNFYWLSTKPDVLDWKGRKDTVYTPEKEFGDLTGLNSLPQVKLEVQTETKTSADGDIWRVTVKNPSSSIAFMAHLRLTRGRGGDDVVPILWQDNYFSLLPGEQREVSASYSSSSLRGAKPVLEVDGFNITPQTIQ